jgi:sigma-B regulation protein RsbU (phosphoserine phosphatase)
MTESMFRTQLVERRERLRRATEVASANDVAERLLREVDLALARIENGSFGICEVCHDPIEADRIMADPLTRFCIDHLSSEQQRALEHDLDLAARIQRGLLPQPSLRHAGWEAAFLYEAAEVVSGDHCDLIPADDGSLFFVLADVSGKGVAASMLMAHLHAMFRALVPLGLSLPEMVARASRVFCESTLPTHYATLACGRADAAGGIEICNAGHPPPLLVGGGSVLEIRATGVPIGLFCEGEFRSSRHAARPGSTLLLYSDGVTETRDAGGNEYGSGRLARSLEAHAELAPGALVAALDAELRRFRAAAVRHDDLTLLALRRSAA